MSRRHLLVHLKHVIRVLEWCAEHNITLNSVKLQFIQPSVEYRGFDISLDGYTVDQRKLRAISEFPVPQNLTDLRRGLSTSWLHSHPTLQALPARFETYPGPSTTGAGPVSTRWRSKLSKWLWCRHLSWHSSSPAANSPPY